MEVKENGQLERVQSAQRMFRSVLDQEATATLVVPVFDGRADANSLLGNVRP
jgi:hypothetical protein